MSTYVIQHLELSPTSYYGGVSSGWITNKSLAVIYASTAAAQAVIDAYNMYASPVTSGTSTQVTILASGNFAVPAGVSSLGLVECWGAGGGGGGNDTSGSPGSGGGGGGGAYSSVANFAVTPSTNLAVTIGAGGASGTGGNGIGTNGGDGGATFPDTGVTVKAAGGSG